MQCVPIDSETTRERLVAPTRRERDAGARAFIRQTAHLQRHDCDAQNLRDPRPPVAHAHARVGSGYVTSVGKDYDDTNQNGFVSASVTRLIRRPVTTLGTSLTQCSFAPGAHGRRYS